MSASTGPALHVNVFVWPHGYHEAAWRLADAGAPAVPDLAWYAGLAQTAERGLLDAVFLADNMAIPEFRARYLPQAQFDPVAVLSAVAGATRQIGLIATGSTTYSKPWDLARKFATLDHLSGGRAGWNIVTTITSLAAAAFGEASHPDLADRYERAHEFVDVVTQLWDGWDDDAVVADRASGVWADRGRLATTRFHGRFHDVEALLPFPRSPQGRPVLVQAGQSGPGMALAARYAELVFSGPSSLEAAITYRTGLHDQVAQLGRDPRLVPVLPALTVTLGGTEAEARERAQQLDELVDPDFRWQNALWTAGFDPDDFDPDVPLPDAVLADTGTRSSQAERLVAAQRSRPGVPLRTVARDISGGAGQLHFVGTPEQLATFMLDWQDAGAADGFTVMGSTLPRELDTFVDHVVPLLQRAGRFRTGYEGTTLRDHLGLARPDLRADPAS